MSGCILTGQEGIAHRENMRRVAISTGCSLPPLISQYCGACGAHHAIRMQGEGVDERFGRAPVDYVPTEPDFYRTKVYCEVCHAHHSGSDCPGPRQVEEWNPNGKRPGDPKIVGYVG